MFSPVNTAMSPRDDTPRDDTPRDDTPRDDTPRDDTATRPAPDQGPAVVGLVLHDIVRIELVGATPRNVQMVARQLGVAPQTLTGTPDLTIRFVDRLPSTSAERVIASGSVASGDAFMIQSSANVRPARVKIPLDRISGPCEIVCERAARSVPLLSEIVHLMALRRGFLVLHAAAFQYQGQGVVVTGWPGGGKTGVLLAFMAAGATYVSDDVVYLGGTPPQMFGVRQPLEVRSDYLGEFPQLRRGIPLTERGRIRLFREARALMDSRAGRTAAKLASTRVQSRLCTALENRMRAHTTPDQLFGGDAIAASRPFDKVVLTCCHDSPETVVEQVEWQTMCGHLRFAVAHELLPLRSNYLKFRFAFPAATNDPMELIDEIQEELLSRNLCGKQTYLVRHPQRARQAEIFARLSNILADPA